MKRSLKAKLILSYLVVALTTVLVVSFLIRLTSNQSLMNLVANQQTAMLKESVQTYYTANGTMDGFFDYYLQSSPDQKDQQPPADTSNPNQGVPGSQPPKIRTIRGVDGLVDAEYRALTPIFGYQVGEIVPAERLKDAIAVEVNGQTVAWILQDKSYQFKLSDEEELYLKRTTLVIGFAALAGVLVAVAMGVFLAGGLLKPIRRLINASRALAHGNLEQQVPVTSQDELGQLTVTFNQMSEDLAQVDQQRKQMTADITHDLSTPLQIISGYVEMLEEGEVQLTPQRLEIIKTEIGHLRRLVGDLSTLTQAESGALDIQLQPIPPAVLMDHIYHAYEPIAARQGVELELNVPENTPVILVDEGRMIQVLKNLVDNAMRYTPKGGKIGLSAVEMNQQVQLRVTDTGMGIHPEDLPYVFDRFFRADKARGGNSGKMGLGLAICKALVTAQNGQIYAESPGKGQGTSMVICLAPAPDSAEE